MISELLDASGQRLLVPVVVVSCAAVLVRGLFSLLRSRSQDRRDFLDLFREWESRDDLWVTVAVRHLFGAYLPSALIRQLMAGPQPGRAMQEVANAWSFLDMNDETGEVFWRRRWFRSSIIRKVIVWAFPALYVVSASLALWFGWQAAMGRVQGIMMLAFWIYAVGSALAAAFFLTYGDNLKEAQRAAARWMGLQ